MLESQLDPLHGGNLFEKDFSKVKENENIGTFEKSF